MTQDGQKAPSSQQIELREATDDDLLTIVAVIRAAFAEYAGKLDPPSSAEHKSVEVVRHELIDGVAFVALHGDTMIGCVFFHPHSDHVYLGRLAVLPYARNRGVAAILMHAVETRAVTLGYMHVRLGVRLALTENRAYYERRGYRLLSYGTHGGYTAPTFVTLEKPLS